MNRVLVQTQQAGGALRTQGQGASAGQSLRTSFGGYCQAYTQQGYFGWQLPTR